MESSRDILRQPDVCLAPFLHIKLENLSIACAFPGHISSKVCQIECMRKGVRMHLHHPVHAHNLGHVVLCEARTHGPLQCKDAWLILQHTCSTEVAL
eukprot:2461452-Amphidinium_carterae.1